MFSIDPCLAGADGETRKQLILTQFKRLTFPLAFFIVQSYRCIEYFVLAEGVAIIVVAAYIDL